MAERDRRRLALAGAALLLLVALALAGIWTLARARCFQIVGEAICHVDTRQPMVALSFDDGPTPEGVDAVLPVLAHHGAHATFFLIGRDMERHPGQAERLLAGGHELGNHSYSHQRMWGLFPGPYRAEIARTDALLRAAGVAHPTLFRPPYGKRPTGLPIALRDAGYASIPWDVEDPEDGVDARTYADRVLARVRPGSIILMHVMMYRSRQVARRAAAHPGRAEGSRTGGGAGRYAARPARGLAALQAIRPGTSAASRSIAVPGATASQGKTNQSLVTRRSIVRAR